MRITELIAELQAIYAEHGDLQVMAPANLNGLNNLGVPEVGYVRLCEGYPESGPHPGGDYYGRYEYRTHDGGSALAVVLQEECRW